MRHDTKVDSNTRKYFYHVRENIPTGLNNTFRCEAYESAMCAVTSRIHERRFRPWTLTPIKSKSHLWKWWKW